MPFLQRFSKDLDALVRSLRDAVPASDLEALARQAELEACLARLRVLSRRPLPPRDPFGRPFPAQARDLA